MLIEFMGRPESTVAFSGATGYMPIRKSADITELLESTPQIQTAIDQLEVTRTQDYARVFLPGADQEMADSVGTMLTAEGDVEQALTALQATLQGIYDSQIEPNLPG